MNKEKRIRELFAQCCYDHNDLSFSTLEKTVKKVSNALDLLEKIIIHHNVKEAIQGLRRSFSMLFFRSISGEIVYTIRYKTSSFEWHQLLSEVEASYHTWKNLPIYQKEDELDFDWEEPEISRMLEENETFLSDNYKYKPVTILEARKIVLKKGRKLISKEGFGQGDRDKNPYIKYWKEANVLAYYKKEGKAFNIKPAKINIDKGRYDNPLAHELNEEFRYSLAFLKFCIADEKKNWVEDFEKKLNTEHTSASYNEIQIEKKTRPERTQIIFNEGLMHINFNSPHINVFLDEEIIIIEKPSENLRNALTQILAQVNDLERVYGLKGTYTKFTLSHTPPGFNTLERALNPYHLLKNSPVFKGTEYEQEIIDSNTLAHFNEVLKRDFREISRF